MTNTLFRPGVLLGFGWLLVLLKSPSEAAPLGTGFTYQGRLADGGLPADGLYDLQFTVYDALNNGTVVSGPVTLQGAGVSNGLFTTTMDFGAGVFTGNARWLEIAVRTNGGVGFTTMTPRQALMPAPYALFSGAAGSAATAPWNALTGVPAGFADGVDNNTTYSAGNGLNLTPANRFDVLFGGSGLSTTAARSDHDHFGQNWSGAQSRGLSVTTTANMGTGIAGLVGHQGSGAGYSLLLPSGVWGDSSDGLGVLGTTASAGGAGLEGWHFANPGSGAGVYGLTASDNGRGVRGNAYSTTGINYGVYGESSSPDGFGGYFVNGNGWADTAVRGVADLGGEADLHPSGLYPSAAGEFVGRVGVIGAATTNISNGYGVVGTTPGVSGLGVFGNARATNGINFGVYGRSDSVTGHGVYGFAKATSGENYGVRGLSLSPDGFGVYGHAGGTSGLNFTRGAGVFGESNTNTAIAALARSGRAIYAESVSGDALFAMSDSGGAVVAASRTARAVEGSSSSREGVVGISLYSTGVRAHSSQGNPLEAYAGSTLDPSRRFYVSNSGNVYADGTFNPGGADIAEAFAVEGDRAAYGPGDVLEISEAGGLLMKKSTKPYSTLVAGVYATKPGVVLSEGNRQGLSALVPVGVLGVLPTKVTDENGPIRKGALVVSSSTPGHAMKGTNPQLLPGALIGKALEDFSGPGTGIIKVLVNVK